MDGHNHIDLDEKLGSMSFDESKACALRPTVEMDFGKYLGMANDLALSEGLTEEDCRVFLTATWNVMFEFASLGFDLHPTQQVKKTCGKN